MPLLQPRLRSTQERAGRLGACCRMRLRRRRQTSRVAGPDRRWWRRRIGKAESQRKVRLLFKPGAQDREKERSKPRGGNICANRTAELEWVARSSCDSLAMVQNDRTRQPGYRQTLYPSQTPRTRVDGVAATTVADRDGKCERVDSVVGVAGGCRSDPKAASRCSWRRGGSKSTLEGIGRTRAIVQSRRGVA